MPQLGAASVRKAEFGTFRWFRLFLVALALAAASLSQTLEGPLSMRAALLGAAVICLLETTGEIDAVVSYLRSKVPADPVEFGDLVGNLIVSGVLLLGIIFWLC